MSSLFHLLRINLALVDAAPSVEAVGKNERNKDRDISHNLQCELARATAVSYTHLIGSLALAAGDVVAGDGGVCLALRAIHDTLAHTGRKAGEESGSGGLYIYLGTFRVEAVLAAVSYTHLPARPS